MKLSSVRRRSTRMQSRMYFFFFFILIVASSLYAIYSTIGFSFLYNRVFELHFEEQDTRCDIGALRQDVAQRLKVIKVQLELALSQGIPPFQETLTSIESTIWQLNPKLSTLVQDKSPDVCAEVYANNSIGYPLYETGWIRPCGDVSLKNLLTVLLLPTPLPYGSCSTYLSWILSGLKQYYPSVHIIIANRYDECRLKHLDTSRIKEVTFSASDSEGKILNSLLNNVNTSYVFIGRNLNHLNEFARFERQISVFSIDSRIKIVSGAIRNISGHWKVGCFQTEMKNYVLEYQEGYHSSKNECMFCDYVLGPFVADTKFLKDKVSFDQQMPSEVVYEDLFTRVRNLGALILNCPDVMYFSTQSLSYNRPKWLPMAIKWQLNYINLPSLNSNFKTKLNFSCNDIQISCKTSDKAAKTHLIPKCCIDDYVNAFKFMQTLAEKHKFKLELDSGSVVGVVKTRGVLPWDVDGDLVYLSTQHKLIVGLKDLIEKNGFRLEIISEPEYSTKHYRMTGGYMTLWTPEQGIELFGMDYLSDELLPSELRNVTTKAEMNGVWMYSPANPGLFVRNRYGVECLQHAHHWRLAGQKNSWDLYKAGIFNVCPKQGHHACAERFIGDGDSIIWDGSDFFFTANTSNI